MDIRPIPAFYCCYLLRSTVRHASLYIGSTPNPWRRLAQHNGQVKGGAVRTSRTTLRPWEMTCIIAGFPSNIAALQFEWAWHNAHLTRHIPNEERISFATTRTKLSLKSGTTRKRPGRPRSSLAEKLSNLHLLLRVPYFSQWPLELRFFSEDVYQLWETWCQREHAQIPPLIKVWLDKPKDDDMSARRSDTAPTSRWQRLGMAGTGGIRGVDPTYASFKPVLEKGRFLLEEDESFVCGICSQVLHLRHDLITICPQNECQSFHHMACLARHFLQSDPKRPLIPTTGQCPSCRAELTWVDLMKEMTLRIRSQKELHKVLKARPQETVFDQSRIDRGADEDPDYFGGKDVDDDPLKAEDVVDEEGDDTASVTSVGSDMSHSSAGGHAFTATASTSLPVVIEDSDADEIDLLDDEHDQPAKS